MTPEQIYSEFELADYSPGQYVCRFRGMEAFGRTKNEALKGGLWLVLSELRAAEAKLKKIDPEMEKMQKIREILK